MTVIIVMFLFLRQRRKVFLKEVHSIVTFKGFKTLGVYIGTQEGTPENVGIYLQFSERWMIFHPSDDQAILLPHTFKRDLKLYPISNTQ